MNADELRSLARRILEDVGAVEADRLIAREAVEALQKTPSPAAMREHAEKLEEIRKQIEARRRQSNTPLSPAQDGMYWDKLSAPLRATEQNWERRGRRQYVLGAAMVPGLVIAMIALAVYMPHDSFMLVFLSELAALALSYSYVILRIQQQSSIAEERMAEKRVGLTFLQIALEQYSGRSEFDVLVKQGTEMFLGHHAPHTIPLGPEDAKAFRPTPTPAGESK